MHGKMRNVWQILSKLFFNISKLISNKYNQLLIDVLTYPSSSSRAHVIHSLQVNIYYPSHYSTPQSGSKYRFRIHTPPPLPTAYFFLSRSTTSPLPTWRPRLRVDILFTFFEKLAASCDNDSQVGAIVPLGQ